jgi:hypothetical protein
MSQRRLGYRDGKERDGQSRIESSTVDNQGNIKGETVQAVKDFQLKVQSGRGITQCPRGGFGPTEDEDLLMPDHRKAEASVSVAVELGDHLSLAHR